jgi:hypothetical protein
VPASNVQHNLRIIQNERALRFRAMDLQRQHQEITFDPPKRSLPRRFLSVSFVRFGTLAVLGASPIRPS